MIVSGGDTGVDRAALDVARSLGIACGGWCPAGRVADDGRIHRCYGLAETPSANYLQCTDWNVRDSDGTLILARGRLSGGTLNTLRYALQRYRKPALVLQVRRGNDLRRVRSWLRRRHIRVLNVGGPREAKRRGIYRQARALLSAILKDAGQRRRRRFMFRPWTSPRAFASTAAAPSSPARDAASAAPAPSRSPRPAPKSGSPRARATTSKPQPPRSAPQAARRTPRSSTSPTRNS